MITLELPFPPSVNTYWRHVVMGRSARTLISKKGREYRTAVQQAVMLQRGPKAGAGRLTVAIDAYPPDLRQRDLDNMPKAVLDALTHAGVWLDDSQIDALQIVRREAMRGGKVVVQIRECAGGIGQIALFDAAGG